MKYLYPFKNPFKNIFIKKINEKLNLFKEIPSKKYIKYICIFLLLCIFFYLLYLLYSKYTKNQKYKQLKSNIQQKLSNSQRFESFINQSNIVPKSDEAKMKESENISMIDYTYYSSNHYDSYDLLQRDLQLYSNRNNNSNNNSNNNNYIMEHMESKDDMSDLFPDLNKGGFAMTANQSEKDLLVRQEYIPDDTPISDVLLKMDTRPQEQKDLDSIIKQLNMFLYLLKKSILSDLANKRQIKNNKKITLYYSLFEDNFNMGKMLLKEYNNMKLTPGYKSDPALDSSVKQFLEGPSSICTLMISIYTNIFNLRDVETSKKQLETLYIPTPSSIGGEDEDDVKDPISILREFADAINDMYDSLNTVIAPYYNFVLELNLAPYPRDNDEQDPNAPDNKSAAALIASFSPEMISFISLYNDLMINYIFNEDIYQKLVQNKNYQENLLSLPNISSENKANIQQLLKSKVIDDAQISSFDKCIELIVPVYDYFSALYQLTQADVPPEDLDIESMDNILRGNKVYDQSNQRYQLFKKNDPPPDEDVYIYAIKNMVTNNEIIFKSLVEGFTTAKSIPSAPTKESINKAKTKLSAKITKAFNVVGKELTEFGKDAAKELTEFGKEAGKELTKVGNEIASGTVDVAQDIAKGATQAANVVAAGTVDVAQDVAKGATQAANVIAGTTVDVANDIAKGTTQVANDIAKGSTQVANEVAQGTTELANDIAKGTTEVANDIAKGTTEVANDIAKGATNVMNDIGSGVKDVGKDLEKGATKAANKVVKGVSRLFK